MHTKSILSSLAVSTSLLVAFPAQASHILGGSITYRIPDPNNSPNTVEFDVYLGTTSNLGNSTIELQFGDGTSAPIGNGAVISQGFSSPMTTRHTLKHTYPAAMDYVVSVNHCCRQSTLVQNADDMFRLESRIDLSAGNSAAPLSFMHPIVQLQTNGIREIFIPAGDIDGAPVACRFATSAESGLGVNPTPTSAGNVPTLLPSISPPGCNLAWDLTGALVSQRYAIAIVAESQNGAQISATPIQFVAETVAAPPPQCTTDGLVLADIGAPVNANFTGTGSTDLTLGLISSAAGTMPNPGTVAPSPFNSSLQWTPTPSDAGLHLFQVLYTNSMSLHTRCSMFVEVKPCPQFGTACSVGVGACMATGTTQCNSGAPFCTAMAGMPTSETCDNIDNDCDGVVDNGCGGMGGMGGSGGMSSSSGTGGMAPNGSGGSPAAPPQGQSVEKSSCAYHPGSINTSWAVLGCVVGIALGARRRRTARTS